MPSNPETEKTMQHKMPDSDEWSGPWGVIEPVPHSVETLCLEIDGDEGKPTRHYYPYRTIGKWSWSRGEPETLEILLAGTQVTISGKGLRRLAEALNTAQLKLIHSSTDPNRDGEITISEINIEA